MSASDKSNAGSLWPFAVLCLAFVSLCQARTFKNFSSNVGRENAGHVQKTRLGRVYLAPSYYWYQDVDKNIWMLDAELYLRFSSFNNPNINLPVGLNWEVGTHLVYNPDDNFLLLPLPYFGIGAECRIADTFFVYPHIKSIGFPFTLSHNYWLFTTYVGIDVGARFQANDRIFMLYYSLNRLGFIEDIVLFSSVSLALML